MKFGKLYLIPAPLSKEQEFFILDSDVKRIAHLKDFVVENPKSARATLGKISLNNKIQELELKVLDEHTKSKNLSELLTPVLEGRDLGLLSDAGVPAVADPGSKLVELAHRTGVEVVPINGPSSIILALMSSGLNGQRFAFEGYLPTHKDQRIKQLRQLENDSYKARQTKIFIETPYRNKHMLNDILTQLKPSTMLTIASDLTGPSQLIKTAPISQWKKQKWPNIENKPTIFLIEAK